MAKQIQTIIALGGKVLPSLQKAFDKMQKNSEQLEKAYQATSKVGVAAFKAVGVASAAVVGTLIAAAETTRDLRKDLNKMYTNATEAGISLAKADESLANLYGVSGEFDSANEALSNLIASGYKGKDLAKIIESVNGATIKWQDTITAESLSDSIQETISSGKSIGQFDEVLSRSGVNVEKWNAGFAKATTAAERQQYVLDWLAKSGLTEVNAAYQKNNKAVVDAYKADLKKQQAMAKLGEVAEPLVTMFNTQLAGALTHIAGRLENVDLEKASDLMERFGDVAIKAFDLAYEALAKVDWETVISAGTTIFGIFYKIFSFVVNNWGLISPVIYGVVAAMVAYKAIMLTSKAITAISTAANIAYVFGLNLLTGGTLRSAAATAIATAAQSGLNLAFLACPITWIVLGIAAIVAIIAVFAKKVGGFKELWKICWNGITKAFGVAKKEIGDGIQWITDKIKALIDWFEGIGDWFSRLFGGGDKTINVNVKGKEVKAAQNALGGTYSKPLLTWVSEGGDTETIVPHNNKPRSKALALTALQGTGTKIGGSSFVFSPVIHVHGKADETELRGIMQDAEQDFERRMSAWENEQRRVSFA